MTQAFDPLALSIKMANKLCDEVIHHDGQATWLGDEKENVDGSWEVVHRSVNGDLYGGTAGIGLFLSRLYGETGEEPLRTTALAALRYSIEWQKRMRPSGSLYAGSAGIAAVLAEAGTTLKEEALLEDARRLTDESIERLPAELDLIAGRAGTITALLYLARTLGSERALDAAIDIGHQLVTVSQGDPYHGACWQSDIGANEPPLCGMAHGASGIALALAELSLVADDQDFAQCAGEAALYERTWFQREQGNWPDLRELTRSKLQRGETPLFPLLWCHGGIGIGLARLRQYEITRENIYAVEAESAIMSAEKQIAQLLDFGQPIDLCLCHGLAGNVELLLEGARIFAQPRLSEIAMSCGLLAAEQGKGEEASWPCGVPEGGENPSLMLGLAGIGMMFLRLAKPSVASTGILFANKIMKTSIIVQLDETESPSDYQKRAEEFVNLIPGSKVERISRRGRVLLRIASAASVDDALKRLNACKGVRYAEVDVIDHATDSGMKQEG